MEKTFLKSYIYNSHSATYWSVSLQICKFGNVQANDMTTVKWSIGQISAKYYPILANYKSIESLFIQIIF